MKVLFGDAPVLFSVFVYFDHIRILREHLISLTGSCGPPLAWQNGTPSWTVPLRREMERRAASPKEYRGRVTEEGNGKAGLANTCFSYRTLF